MKILIVEDERIISLALRQTVRMMGHEVLACAASGEEALDVLAACAADLVLLDIQLEGLLDGVDTARLIAERFGTPVAFTSAYSDDATRSRAAGLRPVAFLAKPVNPGELAEALERLGAPRGAETNT